MSGKAEFPNRLTSTLWDDKSKDLTVNRYNGCPLYVSEEKPPKNRKDKMFEETQFQCYVG